MAITRADKPGVQTTEFWGKSLLQIILVLNVLFDLGIEVDEQMAMTIVAGLEAAYQLGRSLVKAISSVRA